jgi:hypothetical protein
MKYLKYILLFVTAFSFSQSLLLEVSRQQANTGGVVGAIPVYEDTSTYAETAGGTSVTLNYPTTVNVDDMLIAQVFKDENVTFTVPSGWNLISQSASNYSQFAIWKRALGNEDGTTFSVVNSGSAGGYYWGVVHRFSGVNTSGTPFESLATQDAAFIQNPTHNIESMTSTGANRLAVGLVYCGDNRTILTDVVDYTVRYTQKRTLGLDSWLLAYTYDMATASTVSQNTIDFDQNEGGGTINFLLLPE